MNHGLLLLDELENGIHYSVYPKIANHLVEVSKIGGIQIFVATHSQELIEAILASAKNQEFEKLSLLNMSYISEKGEVVTLDSQELQFASEADTELRS